MSADRTQQQTPDQIKSSEDLSLKPRQPPAKVSGYEIDSLLGTGAYGEVWMALDQKTGRRVAIKFYTRQTSLDFSLLSREVEKLVFLSADRYVVQLLDVGWEADPPYYVMDHIDNGSLEDELRRRTTLPVDEAVELTEEICIGLMHLHGKGILHCDLKPGNVLLDQDKKPRLADFGQSRLSHEQAPALGTLFFMAPEQADLQAVPDARWDVYALGALLYCMLTGHPPFRDDDALSKIDSSDQIEDRLQQYRNLIQDAPKPTDHRRVPGVDRNLAEIIDRCIARNPNNRFSSVQSVLQALRQRDLAHAKKPLIVLGLAGPLLLLAVMSLFAWNAYQRAISQSDQSITKKTLESNHWVAQLAARSAREQIDKYFRVVSQLANDENFKSQFVKVINDPQIQSMIEQFADPRDNSNQALADLREEFKNHQARKDLHRPLLRNLRDANYPTAASWFVCDATGTQIASEFNQENPANTIGKNYSWRTYFTGRDRDADSVEDGETAYDVTANIRERQHIDGPNISAIFISRATGKRKIAFSKPILVDGKFIGIAAVTADMGDFIEFQNAQAQYVMLVDGRDGEFRGTVLEHPLIEQLSKTGQRIPEPILERRVDDQVLTKFDTNDFDLPSFHDPMGNVQLGAAFDHDHWIASWADVVSQYLDGSPQSSKLPPTGLKVIAVEDHQAALLPTRNLGRQLARMATIAFALFLLVTGGLIFIVTRSIRRSREKVARLIGGTGDTNSLQAMSTVMAKSGSTGSGSVKLRE